MSWLLCPGASDMGCLVWVQSLPYFLPYSWWRNQRETFSELLALSAGNSLVTGEFPSRRPVTRNFDVFFDLHLKKRLSKQSRCRWFETPLHSLCIWPHYNGDQLITLKSLFTSGNIVIAEYFHNDEPLLSTITVSFVMILLCIIFLYIENSNICFIKISGYRH